ncbi:LacI family DNA-binding transcriptional regulator [Treponema sp. OMZ 840]|uniref:LacI family DNA-binding transcriptional regulator n=1 Tax=Treponema sp. OMZ 840 TaxID=244313 RepID=UPI003D8B9EE2
MTINDIAELAGVSISTVSKIINGKDNGIKTETRERVLKIVKDYRYKPYDFIKKKYEFKNFFIRTLFVRY